MELQGWLVYALLHGHLRVLLIKGPFSLTYVHANIGPFDKLTLGCDPLYKRSTGK